MLKIYSFRYKFFTFIVLLKNKLSRPLIMPQRWVSNATQSWSKHRKQKDNEIIRTAKQACY